MKIGILSRGPQNHSTRRLSEAALHAGHIAEILDPFGFYLHIGGTGNRITYEGKPAEDFDVIVPRLSRTTARYGEEVVAHFEWIGTPVINRAKPIAAARHKFHSLRVLAQHGLPIPPSLTVGSHHVFRERRSRDRELSVYFKTLLRHTRQGRNVVRYTYVSHFSCGRTV